MTAPYDLGNEEPDANRNAESTADRSRRRDQRRATRNLLLAKTIAFAALTYSAMVLYHAGILPLWGLMMMGVSQLST